MTARPALPDLVSFLEDLSLEAGRIIMPFYENGCETLLKEDESPVTAADQAAEAFILNGLRSAFGDIPVIAEEEISAGHIPSNDGELFFLVDPLDGTKEFINGRSDFTVNIALIDRGVPVAGVVYAPARQEMFSGYTDDGLAQAWHIPVADFAAGERVQIAVTGENPPKTAVASRSHLTAETEAFLKDNAIEQCVSIGSSLKFCLLACGQADIYPRFGRTMEWDTAAGDAVLRAAGGETRCPDGHVLQYNKRLVKGDCAFANPHFVAIGFRAQHMTI